MVVPKLKRKQSPANIDGIFGLVFCIPSARRPGKVEPKCGFSLQLQPLKKKPAVKRHRANYLTETATLLFNHLAKSNIQL